MSHMHPKSDAGKQYLCTQMIIMYGAAVLAVGSFVRGYMLYGWEVSSVKTTCLIIMLFWSCVLIPVGGAFWWAVDKVMPRLSGLMEAKRAIFTVGSRYILPPIIIGVC